MEIVAIIGVVAGIVSFIAHPLYIFSIIRGETKAHPATWFSETLLAAISLLFLIKAGGGDVRYVLWGDLIGFFLITFLASYYAELRGEFKKFINIESILCILGVVISITIFIVSENALLALITTLAAEFFALWPTIHKTYNNPQQEDKLAWIFTCTGDALNLGAMKWGNPADMWYVFAIFFVDGLVLFLITVSPFAHNIAQRMYSRLQKLEWGL